MVGGALPAMGQWMDRLGRAYEQETKRSHKVMGCQRKGVWILLKCLESHRRAIFGSVAKGKCHQAPSQHPGPTWWQERTVFYKLSSDLHGHSQAHTQ